jgi:alcohol dehydrogenase (NADP+)
MAVKLAAAMQASVTVISLSESQRSDAMRLGAQDFIVADDEEKLKAAHQSLNLIIDTVPVPHDLSTLLKLLTYQGVLCM